jgi:hypothetical protein
MSGRREEILREERHKLRKSGKYSKGGAMPSGRVKGNSLMHKNNL